MFYISQYKVSYRCKPELCLVLITLVATNVFLPDENVRILAAEGGPVLAELPHGDKVGGAGGETAGGAKQSVAVMFPPIMAMAIFRYNVLTFLLGMDISSVSHLLNAKNT